MADAAPNPAGNPGTGPLTGSGAFAPLPGGAPLWRQVAAQAAMEARLMLRNGEQLLLAVVIPVLILVGGVTAGEHLNLKLTDPRPLVDIFTPGVLALAVMSTSFTSLAIATGFERRYGVIKRLGASPLPRVGLLAGKVVALLLVELLQMFVIGGVGQILGWTPEPGAVGFFLAVLLGTAAFASLGLFVAGVLRAEATLAAANLIYLLLMAGGAVVLPISAYGGFGDVARWLPSGALGEAIRAAFLHAEVSWRDLGVLLAWALIGTGLTARTFTWE
ncbi:MAG: ABC transporter permease [Nocardioides sp.]|uniref:ABC transporter permease n=1 Tax=Nocardioides sp. TaxID=35761 RepID=UPI0039E2F0F4